jgi:hypothetical protein
VGVRSLLLKFSKTRHCRIPMQFSSFSSTHLLPYQTFCSFIWLSTQSLIKKGFLKSHLSD